MKKKKNSIFEFLEKDIELSLNKKIKKIELIIQSALFLSKNPLLLFSGGKDSLLLLNLLLKYRPDINVLLVDCNMNFPEFNIFLEKEIKPNVKNFYHVKVPYSEKEYVEKFDIPFFKGLSYIGYSKKDIKKLGLSSECSNIKEKIMIREEKKLKPDLVFMGFLATESKKRLDRAKDWSYLKLSYPENVCIPLAMLKEEEVFKLMDRLKIKYIRDVYFKKNNNRYCRGDGTCWMCSADCFDKKIGGNWEIVKTNYPKLWKKIVDEYKLPEKLKRMYDKTKDSRIKDTYDRYFPDKNNYN